MTPTLFGLKPDTARALNALLAQGDAPSERPRDAQLNSQPYLTFVQTLHQIPGDPVFGSGTQDFWSEGILIHFGTELGQGGWWRSGGWDEYVKVWIKRPDNGPLWRGGCYFAIRTGLKNFPTTPGGYDDIRPAYIAICGWGHMVDNGARLGEAEDDDGDGSLPISESGNGNNPAPPNPPPTYALTVNSGTGTGSYAAAQQVNISANAAPPNQVFDVWTESPAGIVQLLSSPSTVVTMPSQSATVTATYRASGGGGGGGGGTTYTLTVQNGTGSGTYAAGTVVTITANAAPPGSVFSSWGASPNGIVANPTSPTTTVTMPSGNATVTAIFTPNQGGGGGGGNTPPVITTFIVNKNATTIFFSGTVTDNTSPAGMAVAITMTWSGGQGNSSTLFCDGMGNFSGSISTVGNGMGGTMPLPPGTYTFRAVAGPDSGMQFSAMVQQSIVFP